MSRGLLLVGRRAEVDPAGQLPGTGERRAQALGEVGRGRQRRAAAVALVDPAGERGRGLAGEQVEAADLEGRRAGEAEALRLVPAAHLAQRHVDVLAAEL